MVSFTCFLALEVSLKHSIHALADVDMAEVVDAADESADTSAAAAAPVGPAMNGGDGKEHQNRLPSRQQASRERNKGRRSKG